MNQISPVKERFFHEEHMYIYLERYARLNQLDQTLKALPYARKIHEGQFRKGKEKIPYIYHPLMAASQALALGLDSDDIIATALLHDVCEDCGVMPDELPVGERVKTAVVLLTKDENYDSDSLECKVKYYSSIAENELAVIVKILDRCHNISGIAGGFTKERMLEYIAETENWFYPLIKKAKTDFLGYEHALFAMEYHMISVVEAIKHLI